MIGKNQIVIDASEFVKGMSSGADVSDGGFSNETDAVNLIANPGVLYAPVTPTDKSGVLAGNIIASASDANVSGVDRYFLTTTGKYFYYQGGALTLAQTDAVGSYLAGTTDIVQFDFSTYATTTNNIVLLTGSTLATIDATWWTVTKGKSALQTGQRHPMLVFENALWIGDKNKLHKWDGTTATEGFLTLLDGQSIVSLAIDPSTGKMLIGITEGQNYSNTKANVAKVLFYDGVATSKPLRVVIVDDAVNGMYAVGGILYMGYGTKLGYWNGSGITFLRKLKNVTLAGDSLPYKHKMTNIANTLYVADGKQVLAYGEILPGQKKFYYAQSNNISSAAYDCIANIGSNLLALCFATAKLYTLDVTSVATAGTNTFYSNKYNFPRPVYLRGVYLEYADAVTNGDDNRQIYYQSEDKQAGFQILRIQGQTSAIGTGLKNTTGASIYFIDNIIGFLNSKVRSCQFRYNNATAFGLKRIVLYYDPAE